ncbi:MAG TPA: hypothetical protein PK954_01120, partial [Anaerolineales bacterium]|nr:hypothetical protein [Anaerolineales bacterium]
MGALRVKLALGDIARQSVEPADLTRSVIAIGPNPDLNPAIVFLRVSDPSREFERLAGANPHRDGAHDGVVVWVRACQPGLEQDHLVGAGAKHLDYRPGPPDHLRMAFDQARFEGDIRDHGRQIAIPQLTPRRLSMQQGAFDDRADRSAQADNQLALMGGKIL